MRFHEFGDKNDKIIILIHGVLTPWQIWQEQIDFFKEKYFVIVPALDAHVEEEASEYISVEQEAKCIEEYVCSNYGSKVFAVCGLSMGGAIANVLFGNGKLEIEHLVFDGAPLVPTPGFATKMMTNAYLDIIHKSKERDKNTLRNFEKNFLPAKYLDSYLKFADTMSDDSVKNILNSVGESRLSVCGNPNNTRILFLHGTKGNEILAKKSAKLTKRHYPDATILSFKGYMHGELAIYKGAEWIRVVDSFFTDTVAELSGEGFENTIGEI